MEPRRVLIALVNRRSGHQMRAEQWPSSLGSQHVNAGNIVINPKLNPSPYSRNHNDTSYLWRRRLVRKKVRTYTA